MPPKQDKHAGAAGAAGGSRTKRKPTLNAERIPLDRDTNPPELERCVQLTTDAEQIPAYECLRRPWECPRISKINDDGTVQVLWQTPPGQFQEFTIDVKYLCYTIAVPSVDINEDGTLAEIQRRTAAEQKANGAKTKSAQDSERALEKARLDAAKLEAQTRQANAKTEARQAMLALELERRRANQLEVQDSLIQKQKDEIAKLKAQLQAQKAQKAQRAPPTLQAATQADVDKLHATMADLNAQLTAATTGAARNNDEEVDELRLQLREAKIQVKTYEGVISTLEKRGFEGPFAADMQPTTPRQKLKARVRDDDEASRRPRKKQTIKVPAFSASESDDDEAEDDAEAGPMRPTQARRRGGGIAGRAAGGRAVGRAAGGRAAGERAKSRDKQDSARARGANEPRKASNEMEMEMEEVSDNDTAGAPATPRRQMTKQQAPLTSEEREEVLLREWLLKLGREYEADLKRWAELNKSDPESHNRSGEDFWYPDGIEHKQWKRLPEFMRYVVMNLPLTVYITNNTSGIGKWVLAMDQIDMSHSNFDPEHCTNWRIVVKFLREKSDGTWESVRVPISSTFITGFEENKTIVWAKRHTTLGPDQKNWCDMKMEMLESHKENTGRCVPPLELFSWTYDPTSEVEAAPKEQRQPRPPGEIPGAKRAPPRPQQAPPPPPQPNAEQVDERPTVAGKRVPILYNVLVDRRGAITAQRNGSSEPEDGSPEQQSSPEPEEQARPTGALGGAAARRQYIHITP
jgi:hypothetical protein